jgi:hypothetical protein
MAWRQNDTWLDAQAGIGCEFLTSGPYLPFVESRYNHLWKSHYSGNDEDFIDVVVGVVYYFGVVW